MKKLVLFFAIFCSSGFLLSAQDTTQTKKKSTIDMVPNVGFGFDDKHGKNKFINFGVDVFNKSDDFFNVGLDINLAYGLGDQKGNFLSSGGLIVVHSHRKGDFGYYLKFGAGFAGLRPEKSNFWSNKEVLYGLNSSVSIGFDYKQFGIMLSTKQYHFQDLQINNTSLNLYYYIK